jgi:hypothetical protein
MSILNSILDKYPEEGFIKADGFDEAIIGVSTDIRLVYSVDKIIESLMKDMSEDDAIDYFYFNIDGAYLGDKTPIYIHLIN